MENSKDRASCPSSETPPMDGVNLRRLPRWLRSRGLVLGLWAGGCSALVGGCELAGPVVRLAAPADAAPAPTRWQHPQQAGVVQTAYHPEPAPPPTQLPPVSDVAAPVAKPLPINLDTVLRLAEEQNAQIGVARAKVDASLAENEAAARGWLPKVYAGVGYFRHEGGIQNENGTLTRSSFGTLFPGVEINAE